MTGHHSERLSLTIFLWYFRYDGYEAREPMLQVERAIS